MAKNPEKKQSQKETILAIGSIVIYVVALGSASNFASSRGINVEEQVANHYTFPVVIVLTILALVYLFLTKTWKYYGLCKGTTHLKSVLYYLPLLVIATPNLWFGITFRGWQMTIIHIIYMICVAFLEEIIFRGFLLRSDLRDCKLITAIVISAVTFGIGHIVNLLTGINGADVLPTLMQVVYATAIGFAFVLLTLSTESLIPCIIAHAFINSTSILGPDIVSNRMQYFVAFMITVVSIIYSIFLWKKNEAKIRSAKIEKNTADDAYTR